MAELRYRLERQTMGALQCAVITSDAPPAALAVLCHGFGAPGDDLVGLARDLLEARSSSQPIELIFPAALLSLADEGYGEGRAWWRLSIQRLIAAMESGQFDSIKDESPPGIEEARQALVDVVNTRLQQTGLKSSHLLLGGFSQGAMLAMEVACCGLTDPPRALALFSGCLIRQPQWQPAANRLAGSRIVQSHGSLDPILPLQAGQWLQKLLVDAGCTVEFLQFHGPHTIPWEAIEATAHLMDELTG